MPAIDPATVTTWPAAVVSIAGIAYVIFQQWRQSRITRRVEHEVTDSTLAEGVTRIESKLDDYVAAEPRRRSRARREAAALAMVGAAVSIAVTLTRTR